MNDNSHEHKTVTKDGYEVTFHPAFSSRCAIQSNGSDQATELYKQQGKHVFKIKGGEHKRDLELEIRDPKHHVARITEEFYADGHEPGWGDARLSQPVEIVTFDNNTTTCPPDCDGPPSNGG